MTMIVGHNISNFGVVIAIMEINYRHIRDKLHRNYDVKTEASNLLLLLIYTIRELIKDCIEMYSTGTHLKHFKTILLHT